MSQDEFLLKAIGVFRRGGEAVLAFLAPLSERAQNRFGAVAYAPLQPSPPSDAQEQIDNLRARLRIVEQMLELDPNVQDVLRQSDELVETTPPPEKPKRRTRKAKT